jgi:hypothetical protein
MDVTDSRSTDRFDLAEVLRAEYTRLRPDWTPEAMDEALRTMPARPSKEDPLTTAVAKLHWVAHHPPDGQPLAALCLSGGGIRSATFNLGVIQALARAKVLDRFDYLSSVSGGGYVASWLQGWLYRARHGDQGQLLVGSQRLDKIRIDLQGARNDPIRPEARAIRHLREYSNYLTPQLGLLSADTWTSIAIVVRNIFLNWLVLLPLLAAILAMPLLAIATWGPVSEDGLGPMGEIVLCWLGLAFALVGLVFMNALRGVTREEGFACPLPVDAPPPPGGLRQRLGQLKDQFVPLALVPLLAGVASVVAGISWSDLDPYTRAGGFHAALWPSAVLGLALPIAAFLISIPVQRYLGGDWPGAIPVDFFAVIAAGVVETLAYAFHPLALGDDGARLASTTRTASSRRPWCWDRY